MADRMDYAASYDNDVLEWSEHQAALLRRAAAGERVNDLDWPNIIEEIESVGRSQVDAVESLLYQALVHMLKAEGWPDSLDVETWRGHARGFRAQAKRKFRESMREKFDVPGLYSDAILELPATMDSKAPLPLPDCTITLDKLLDKTWDGLLGEVDDDEPGLS